jgi:hypothetical protein
MKYACLRTLGQRSDPDRRRLILHLFTLRWGRVYALEEFQESQAAASDLAAQCAAGVEEVGPKPWELVRHKFH